jgi:outer membrane protein assembly factor BamA
MSVSSSFSTRIQDQLLNNQFSANLRVVFPIIKPVGRFVLAASYANTWNNLNNAYFYLGGSSGLRGTPYRYYQGTQLLSHNLEFRTRSLPFWIFRFGIAAFHDFGCAFNNSSDFNPTYDAGLGLRILIIPWNRLVLRVDAATPIWGPVRGIENTLVTVGFGQAF